MSNFTRLFITVTMNCLILILMGCVQTGAKKIESPKAPAGDTEIGLQTQTLAMWRSQTIRDVSYDLSVELDAKSLEFKGTVKADFTVSQLPEAQKLWLDFRGGAIEHLDINGVKIEPNMTSGYYRNGSLLWLPSKVFKVGPNRITVNYVQDYNTNGVGLHRFQDPEDNEVYVYTHFEPYEACRLFPLFDQPDLRASLKLKVRAPKNWVVIANTSAERISSEADGMSFHNFKPTAPIASYLYALHAGPYKEFKSRHGKIPLRLLIRKSLAPHLPVDAWFQWTQQGLTYFEKYFGVPYAFEKYDQIVVPEFNMGAMENVGAITFSERYIKRGGMTHNERVKLASVILHEMAHQWFGNLVTMKWWDDLWLNESFATFMAAKAMYEGVGFKDAWVDFNSDKQWAMLQDQSVITHPIAATVANTDQAFNNFDDITYGKGGAVIQQLEYLIGEKPFRSALQHYFKIHAYKNTVLRDFIDALQTQAKEQDLQTWSKLWLEQPGLDTLRTDTQCDGKDLKSVSVQLTPSAGAKLRPQAVEVALLGVEQNKSLRKIASQKVLLSGPEQSVTFAKGTPCPALTYPNFGDHGYAKVPLTLKEIETLKENLAQVEDTHLRLMLWTNLWQMVRDGSLAPATYADIALKNARTETDMKIYEFALNTLVGGGYYRNNNALYFMPQETPATQNAHRNMVGRIEGWLIENLSKSPASSDKFKATLKALSQVAYSERALNELYIRASREGLDLDRRWTILKSLCKNNHPKANDLKTSLLALDNSSRGQNAVLACEAATPDLAVKKKLLASVIAGKNEAGPLSGEKQKEILDALVDDSREHFLADLAPEIKAFVRSGLNQRDEDFQADFADKVGPIICDSASVTDFKKFVKNAPLSDVTAQIYKVLIEERELCVQLRQKFTGL